MDKITAKGLFGTVEILLEVTKENEELIFDFNGEEDSLLEPLIRHYLNYAPAMGGTYYPPTNSMLNVVNVLQNGSFFTKLISLEIEGEPETIPFDDSDPNIIY